MRTHSNLGAVWRSVSGYLARWLLATGVLFAASGLAYAVAVGRARAPNRLPQRPYRRPRAVQINPMGIDPDDLTTCLEVLAQIDELPAEHPDAVAVRLATARIFKTVKEQRRAERRAGSTMRRAASRSLRPRRARSPGP